MTNVFILVNFLIKVFIFYSFHKAFVSLVGCCQFDASRLRKLRASFKENGGSVTAGNASSIRFGYSIPSSACEHLVFFIFSLTTLAMDQYSLTKREQNASTQKTRGIILRTNKKDNKLSEEELSQVIISHEMVFP